MSETTQTSSPAPRPTSNSAIQLLRGALIVAAAMVLVGGCVMAGLLLVNSTPSNGLVAAALAAILGGIFLAAILVAASSVVGMMEAMTARLKSPDDVRPALDRLEQSLRMLNSMHSRAETGRSVAEPVTSLVTAPGAPGKPQQLLEQIRDMSMLDEAQRRRYAEHHWAHRKKTHLDAIEREVLVGDWVSAFARLEELQIVLPDDVQIRELAERVESEQAARLDEEVRVARGRLRQMMNASMWQQAEEMVANLQKKYPGKAEADRLVDDVRREREEWERANMERLFRDISASSERRQWRHAILAVEEFIRRYPLDPRADALRLDLPMLQENAAAHERKEQEEHFKDLLKHQRYDEAIAVARLVVAKYPQSPTATELNKLLPRVEELSRAEAARAAGQAGVAVPAAAGA